MHILCIMYMFPDGVSCSSFLHRVQLRCVCCLCALYFSGESLMRGSYILATYSGKSPNSVLRLFALCADFIYMISCMYYILLYIILVVINIVSR